jgi:hypothetical protein
VKSARDKTKYVNPMRIDLISSNEKYCREDRIKWSEKFVYFYESPIVRFYYYGVRLNIVLFFQNKNKISDLFCVIFNVTFVCITC